jgi:hypothetical protein
VAVGEGCCRRAHRTVRCTSHVTQPLGFDRWSCDKWGHRTVQWCTEQSLFTVRCAICACTDFCARSSRTVAHCSPFADDYRRCSRYSAWHTGQSGATPDSPVNYSGEPFSETRSLAVGGDSPWCTGHCPVVHQTVRCARPGQLKGKCALGPFLSILVIECQRKCFCVDLCNVVDKVQIMSKGMFLDLVLCFKD